MSGKYRNWCFTSYQDIMKIDEKKCTYYIMQREVCPTTKKEHWQGYIEFPCQKRMNEAKIVLNDNSCHLEPRWGTQKQAIEYCSKRESRKENSTPIIYGTLKMQGNRSELDSLWDSIESGMTQKEILIEHRGLALKHINMIYKGAKAYHDCCALDSFILGNRKDASEVAGNTEPATVEDIDDITFKKDLKKVNKKLKHIVD